MTIHRLPTSCWQRCIVAPGYITRELRKKPGTSFYSISWFAVFGYASTTLLAKSSILHTVMPIASNVCQDLWLPCCSLIAKSRWLGWGAADCLRAETGSAGKKEKRVAIEHTLSSNVSEWDTFYVLVLSFRH